MRRQTFHGATVYVSNVVDARLQHAQYHAADGHRQRSRSEEHTSELQSHSDLVCRLLLEKKMKIPETALTDLRDVLAAQLNPLSANEITRGLTANWARNDLALVRVVSGRTDRKATELAKP